MIPKHQSIFNAYPNARSIVGEDVYDENDNLITVDETLLTDLSTLESEHALKLLRVKRNVLLAETDWWAVADRTMTAEQTAYRQALRDITNTYTSLDDVVWPTKSE
jgi:hypothetical protein